MLKSLRRKTDDDVDKDRKHVDASGVSCHNINHCNYLNYSLCATGGSFC